MPQQETPSPGTPSNITLQDGTQLDPKVVKVMRAIRQIESGGDYNAVGDQDKGGSHGAYQWNKDNFKKQATALGLDPSDFSPANQNKVAYAHIKSLKDDGHDPEEIAALWNGAKVDPKSGKYTYVNPQYGERFRQALGQQGGMQGNGVNQAAMNIGSQVDQQGGLGNDLKNRVNDLGSAVSDAATGKINPLSGVLQSAGAVAGGVGDVVNAGLRLIPGVSQVEDAIGKGAAKLAGTGVGQQFMRGADKFSQEHPELSKDLSAAFNIATLVPIGKGLGIAGRAAAEAPHVAKLALAETGGVIGKAAKERLFSEALSVVEPKVTPSVAKSAFKQGRVTVSGLAKREGIAPDIQTQRAAESAMGIVRKSWTAAENSNAIRGEIGNVATKLEKDLSTMDVTPIVSRQDMEGLMRNALGRIGENPVLVGDAEESAARILRKFQTYLPKEGDITAGDILKARKQLDSWMMEQTGGSTVFDPRFENAKTIALRAVRQEANQLIATKAPTVAVKGMLARQSALYDALDNVAARGVKEIGTGRLKRFGQRHPHIRALVQVGAGLAGYQQIKERVPFLPLP